MLGSIVCPSGTFFLYGQGAEALDTSSTIEFSDLPDPPSEIADLVAIGKVTFEAGDRDPSLEPVDGPRVAAETRYRVRYRYRSHSDWSRRGDRLVIRVRFRDVQWEPRHVIWFRQAPRREGFWDNSLVRHEFDHVRISADPRFEKSFRDRLRALTVIRHNLSTDQKVDEAMIEKLVDANVAEIFAEVSELIAIRYKELDRLTEHGRTPPPEDFFLD